MLHWMTSETIWNMIVCVRERDVCVRERKICLKNMFSLRLYIEMLYLILSPSQIIRYFSKICLSQIIFHFTISMNH